MATSPNKRNPGHVQLQVNYTADNVAAPGTGDVEHTLVESPAYLNFIFQVRGAKNGITPQLLVLDGHGGEIDITPGGWGAVAGGIGYYEYSRECMGPALKFVLPGNDDSNGAESVVRTFMYATSASRYRT